MGKDNASRSRGRKVGQAAFPFELPDMDGKIRSFGDYQGQWLLMVFHRHLG